MDIVQAVNTRRSIRAFKADPIPLETLKEIMSLTLKAPSWANTQPWEFAIATGKPLAEIRKRYIDKIADPTTPDFQHTSYFPEPYNTRCKTAVAKSQASVGIQRDNKEQRRWWEIRQLSNFEAPCEIFVCLDKSFRHQNGDINVWPIYDCGAAVAYITLLAANYNLGTIIQARAAIHPEVIREVLGLPESRLILVGIAIGYPKLDEPVNQFERTKESVESLVTFRGFEK
jgi:nitroreductase